MHHLPSASAHIRISVITNDFVWPKRWGDIGPAVLEQLAKNAPRNKLIVDQYLKHKDRYGPTIVFAADALHCTTLAEEFRKAGVNAEYVTYDRGDAQAVISRCQEKSDQLHGAPGRRFPVPAARLVHLCQDFAPVGE